MKNYKPPPLEERKSQKLTFWDYTKERLFWVALPFATAGVAMLIGKLANFNRKVWPLDGSPDIVSTLWAKGAQLFAKKHNIEAGEEIATWIKKGAWVGEWITQLGGEHAERLRRYYFNFVKGAEVAAPFSAYFLWHKKEGNRLDLEAAGDKLKEIQNFKPDIEQITTHSEAMRRELASFGQPADAPTAVIDTADAEHHGRLAEPQKQRA